MPLARSPSPLAVGEHAVLPFVEPQDVAGTEWYAYGPVFAQVLDIEDIAPANTPRYMIVDSTDHAASVETTGGLYVWCSVALDGPWT